MPRRERLGKAANTLRFDGGGALMLVWPGQAGAAARADTGAGARDFKSGGVRIRAITSTPEHDGDDLALGSAIRAAAPIHWKHPLVRVEMVGTSGATCRGADPMVINQPSRVVGPITSENTGSVVTIRALCLTSPATEASDGSTMEPCR